MSWFKKVVFCSSFLTALGTCVADAATTMSAGVNLSGLEFNAGTVPGVPNYDYGVPSDSELAYYESKGVMLIRLPILWERMQPGLFASTPSTALSPTYLALVQNIVTEAGARGMQVVVDVHDYGGYGGYKLGGGRLTATQFAAFWRLLATSLMGRSGLGGYDLMNEPSGMPSTTAWPAAAQAATTAIRTVDRTTTIFVEGDDYASAGSWTTYNNTLAIRDTSSRLIYEAHVYGDRDNSGTHFDWATEVANGVTVNTIAQRVAVFSGWCTTKAHTCMIGEVGVGNDNPEWNVELANGLAAMRLGGLSGFTYWAGGPWWGTYPMSIEPTSSGAALQMAVVSLYRE